MLLEPLHSIIDFSFYREIPKRSLPRALGYLAYVGFLFSAFATVVFYIQLNPVVNEVAQWLATSMPAITFENGKASSSLTAPLVLRYPRNTKLAVLIDTNRTTPVGYDELARQNVTFCLTQNALYILDPERREITQRPITEMKTPRPLILTPDLYPRFARYFSRFIYLIMLPMIWGFFFCWKLLAAVFYASAGLIIKMLAAADMDFPTLYKLAIYAQTPVILLQAILLPLHRPLPVSVVFSMGLLVASAYLWQAIRQIQAPPAD